MKTMRDDNLRELPINVEKLIEYLYKSACLHSKEPAVEKYVQDNQDALITNIQNEMLDDFFSQLREVSSNEDEPLRKLLLIEHFIKTLENEFLSKLKLLLKNSSSKICSDTMRLQILSDLT